MRTLILLSCAALAATAQTKSFDTYTYTAPPGYLDKIGNGFIQLNRVDAQRRFACQFGLFPAQPGLASVEQELETEWKTLMTPMYQLTGTPTTRPFGAAGLPENLVRTSTARVGSMPSLVVAVAVIRFPGRYLGVQLTATPANGAEACQEDFAGLLRSIRMSAAAPAPVAAAGSAAAPAGRIPTGITPGLYPGMPGWLPSGAGVPLPEPAMVEGKPVGLWWRAAGALGTAEVRVYLPNGVRASNPRLGGPRLYDLEGQRRQPGANGLGTFDIGGGQIVERFDGFENRYAYAASRDGFQVGGATFRPLLPVTGRSIVGRWRGPGMNFDFREDGTVVYGTDVIPNRGRYVVDGHLLQILPEGGGGWVELVGETGVFLIRGKAMLQRLR